MVQVEMARRKENNDHSSYLYGNKLVCAECGRSYGRKIWHSNDKYRREVWRCNGKYESGDICTTPAVKDDDVQRLFLEAMRRYLDEKDYILKNTKMLKENCLETAPLEIQIEDVIREMEITEKSIKQCI